MVTCSQLLFMGRLSSLDMASSVSSSTTFFCIIILLIPASFSMSSNTWTLAILIFFLRLYIYMFICVEIYIYIYICIQPYRDMYLSIVKPSARRKDGARAPSLLDNFGHFDVPNFDANAQGFDRPSLFLRSLMLKPISSISNLRC